VAVAYCTFCEIVAKREPAEVLYEDDDVLVFRNRLRWVPVMLLAVPKTHVTQEELWRDLGHVGEVAIQMGQAHCPGGFRLVSNFGPDAMQSQPHGHVHILGGTFLREYA
jgi:histidine triad (HIT) family protein